MRRQLVLLASILFSLLHGPAHAQGYSPEQLQSLVAPIALYPDVLVFEVARAAAHPDDVLAAAASPGVYNTAWDRDVQALVPLPEILERMAENPLWMRELAFAGQRQQVELAQALAAMRALAYASGSVVTQSLDYYDPLTAYGAWRPAYPLPQWRQWHTRRSIFAGRERRDFAAEPERREAPRNGPPSKAVQMQDEQLQAGQRGNGGPSPAILLQQKRQ
jgi:hypothetical protein